MTKVSEHMTSSKSFIYLFFFFFFSACPFLPLDLTSSTSTTKSMEEKKEEKPEEQLTEPESAFPEALLEFQ